MVAYATRADLYKFGGVSRGQLANPGRLCASALAETNLFELDGHALETDDPFMVRAESGGELPYPYVEGTTYYAIRVSESHFRGSATPGGSAVVMTTDGVFVVIVPPPLPIDEVLEFYSRFVDPFIPAHAVPFEAPYPITVTAIVAELAAKRLLLLAGQTSVQLDAVELSAKAQLERWATGIPLRDARATAPTNLAYSESVASRTTDRGTLL